MDVQQLTFLCQILCGNAVPQDHLKILRLKLPAPIAGGAQLRPGYDEMELVHFKRCLSLTRLEHFELNELTTDQKLQLSHVMLDKTAISPSRLDAIGVDSYQRNQSKFCHHRWDVLPYTVFVQGWVFHFCLGGCRSVFEGMLKWS